MVNSKIENLFKHFRDGVSLYSSECDYSEVDEAKGLYNFNISGVSDYFEHLSVNEIYLFLKKNYESCGEDTFSMYIDGYEVEIYINTANDSPLVSYNLSMTVDDMMKSRDILKLGSEMVRSLTESLRLIRTRSISK